jgi:hypothetical protein
MAYPEKNTMKFDLLQSQIPSALTHPAIKTKKPLSGIAFPRNHTQNG